MTLSTHCNLKGYFILLFGYVKENTVILNLNDTENIKQMGSKICVLYIGFLFLIFMNKFTVTLSTINNHIYSRKGCWQESLNLIHKKLQHFNLP